MLSIRPGPLHDYHLRRERCFHATRVEMAQAQPAAAGIELQAIGASWPEMNAGVAEELAKLQSDGFRGKVFFMKAQCN